MATLGNNILVLMGGTAIAGTKSNEIQVDCETIEIVSGHDIHVEHPEVFLTAIDQAAESR